MKTTKIFALMAVPASISICNAEKHIHFFLVFPKKLLYLPLKKDPFAMKATAVERGLQIPILDTSELQIRWNGSSPSEMNPRVIFD